jgi:hypothetical protein
LLHGTTIASVPACPFDLLKVAMKKSLPCWLMVLVIAGCASLPGGSGGAGEKRVSTTNLSGFPPEYKQAFAAGCDRFLAGGSLAEAPTGKGGASIMVAQGWRDGFDSCRRGPK